MFLSGFFKGHAHKNYCAHTLCHCSPEVIPALIPDSTCQSVLEQDAEAQNRMSMAVMESALSGQRLLENCPFRLCPSLCGEVVSSA